MRKVIIVLMSVVTALSATAVNRLYLEDFTISPGETMQVALILENDELFTAFQTDIILPEGLSVVQEDEEYLFDLSRRKASDHTVISKLRHDGAIRVVSFSIGVKPYSGNDGALLIINLVADEDFNADALIELKNTFIVTTAGEQFILQGEHGEAQYCEQRMPGDVNGDGVVNIADVVDTIDYLLKGCSTSFHTQNADFNQNGTVDMGDVTDLIDILLQNN